MVHILAGDLLWDSIKGHRGDFYISTYAEIQVFKTRMLNYFRTPISSQIYYLNLLYLGSWVEIQQSPRCPLIESHEWALAKIWSILAHGFGL